MGIAKIGLGPLISHGSSKDKYRIDDKSIAFRFTKYYSVFDVGRAPDEISGKDEAICACAVKSFQVAKEAGVPTHFIEQIDPITIRVEEAQIITGRDITEKDENFVVPAEFIFRLYVAGSIYRKFKSGEKKPIDYGFLTDDLPKIGTPFTNVVHQFTTKFEDIDRDIEIEELCRMSGLTVEDLEKYWAMIDTATLAVGKEMKKAGYRNLDGKIECLMGVGRTKKIGDVFGTPDEDRPVPADKLEKEIIEYHNKEFLRDIHDKSGYKALLDEARKSGLPDPPIPKLSEEDLAETARRYAAVAKAYAGVKINY